MVINIYILKVKKCPRHFQALKGINLKNKNVRAYEAPPPTPDSNGSGNGTRCLDSRPLCLPVEQPDYSDCSRVLG